MALVQVTKSHETTYTLDDAIHELNILRIESPDSHQKTVRAFLRVKRIL